MESVERCSSCTAPMPPRHDRTCLRCGWDGQVGMRKCLRCNGPVILSEVLGYGPIGGVIGIGGVILWRFFGLLLGGAIVCAVGALCGLVSAVFLGYQCSQCSTKPQSSLLSKDERGDFWRRKLGFLIGATLLAAGSIVLFVLFLGAMGIRYG